MKYRFTVLLLILNICIFSSLFFLQKRENTRRAYNERSRQVLSGAELSSVSGFRIESASLESPWLLEKNDAGQWKLREPVFWNVNQFAISRLITQLDMLEWDVRFKVQEILDAGQSLDSYGLELPQLTLSLLEGDQETTIRIGATTQIGNRLNILSPDGEYVYVVSRSLLDAVSLSLDDWLSKRVFKALPYEVNEVGIQTGEGGNSLIQLVKRNDNWSFVSPINVKANTETVDAALTGLTGLSIQGFEKLNPSRQGLLSPRMRISLEGMSGREVLLVGNYLPGDETLFYAKLADSSTVFTLQTEVIHSFENVQQTLREKQFLNYSASSLSSIKIIAGENRVNLQKLESGEWQIHMKGADQEPLLYAVDLSIMDNFLRRLSEFEAKRFVADAPSDSDLESYGLLEPQRKIILSEGTEVQEILLGDYDGAMGGVYAKLENEPYVYDVSPHLLSVSRTDPLYYMDRTLYVLDEEAQIKRIQILSMDSDKPLFVLDRGEEASWDSVLGAYSGLSELSVKNLFSSLEAFSARDIVSLNFEDPFQLKDGRELPWKYRLLVELEYAGRDGRVMKNFECFLSERLGGNTQFGGLKKKNIIFTLKHELIEAIYNLVDSKAIHAEVAVPKALTE